MSEETIMNEYENDVNEETGLNDLLECEGNIMHVASGLLKIKPIKMLV